MNSMKIGEGSSSGDEPRKKDLLTEMQITDQHAKELEGYSFEEILALTMEQLIAIFGAAKGILYSNRLEKIRKRLNLEPTSTTTTGGNESLARNVTKKFSLNGAMDQNDQTCFFVQRKSVDILWDALNLPNRMVVYVYHGPRASGKTSLVWMLHKKIDCIFVDAINFSIGENVFEFLSSKIKSIDPLFPKCSKGIDFEKAFDWDGHHPLTGLIIDEFDCLMNESNLISTLRALKQSKARLWLKFVLVVGVFEVIHMDTIIEYQLLEEDMMDVSEHPNHLQSPFSIDRMKTVIPYSAEEYKDLFGQFAKQDRLTIDPKLLQEIYEYTSGVPGYVSICGYILQDYVLSQLRLGNTIKILTIDLWEQLKFQGLLHNRIFFHKSLERTLTAFQHDRYKNVRVTFEKLYCRFLDSPSFSMEKSRETTILANHGLIVPTDLANRLYTFGPPMILNAFACLLPKHLSVPSDPFPMIFINNTGFPDVIALLSKALPHFDKTKIHLAHVLSHKNFKGPCELNSVKNKKVPKESNYVVEMYGILRSWLKLPDLVLTEVNANKQYADLQILHYPDENSRNPPSGTILELVASEADGQSDTDKGSIREHIARSERYEKVLQSQTWVVHFLSVEQFPSLADDDIVHWFPSGLVHVSYVYHDETFENVKIFYRNAGTSSTPQEKIVFGNNFPRYCKK